MVGFAALTEWRAGSRRLARTAAGCLLVAAPVVADGALDPAFGGGDGVVTRQAAAALFVGALAPSDSHLLVAGRLVVGGSATRSASPTQDRALLARFDVG